MRALLTFIRRLLRRTLIVVLVLVATVNAAAFLLTPLLDRYRDDLAALVSERLGRPIAIGAMQARWRGFGPELVLSDLQVGAPGQPDRIQLADVALDFGLWDMLRYRDLSPLRITLRDLDIHLIRDHAGRLHLAGFEGLAGGDSEVSRLPLAGRLRLLDVTVLWEDQRLNLPVRRLDNARLRLHLWPDRLSMTASVDLPGAQPGQLRAGAELALQGPDWSGEIYLAGQLPEAAAQLGPYLPAPLRLSRGGIEFKAWSDWQASRLSSMEGNLAVDDLQLDRGPGSQPLTLQSVHTDFRYRRDGEQRHVDLADLVIRRDGHRWPASAVHLDLDLSGPGQPAVNLAASYLRLGDLLALTWPLDLPADWQAQRDGLNPDAELRDLHFILAPGEGPPRWQLDTRFDALRSSPWRHYPGVQGLHGRVQGDQQRLRLRLAASDTTVELPSLFDAPLPLARLDGELQWQRDANGDMHLSSPLLTLDTPDIHTRSRLQLLLPADGPASIDLQSTFRDGDGSRVRHYLPTGMMGPQLVRWLKRAITDGHVPRGSLVLRGPLQDFPFETHTGRFEVRFDVTDLKLAYREEWPPLQVDDAEVVFHNNTVHIALRHGRIYDSEVLSTEANIRSLLPVAPVEISGQVHGPLSDPLRLLTTSPLRARFGDLAAGVKAGGDAQLALDFAIPLGDPGKERLKGELQLQQGQLTLPAWDLTLSRADGRLDFDLDGVRASNIQARALGQAVRIDVAPGVQGHRLTVHTRIDAAAVRQRLPALPTGLLSGAAALRIDIDIPNHREHGLAQQLQLSSDLRGMALHLPAPLGKEADSARSLDLTIPLQDDAAPLQLRYGDQLQALFRPGGDRADIRLGGGTAQLPDQPVLRIGGHLEHLQLDPWLTFVEQDGKGVGTLPPLQADLQLDRLQIGRMDIDNIRVQVKQQPDGWHGEASAADFAGSFRIPPAGSDRPIEARLSRFDITLQEDTRPAEQLTSGQPQDWPALDLEIARLNINGHDFGRLALQARHQGNTLRLQPLTLDGPLASFDGLVQWHGSGPQADSSLVGKLHSPRLGSLLAGLGYTPQFDGAPTDVALNLTWPGNPAAASAATLRGQVTLDIGQGQLLDVNPGVARVFGLLNFSALQRRLRLDFSDVFRKGMAFDSIGGNFRLADGNAYTTDLTIKGPSGNIQISGRTGLVDRDLYQEVTVTPRFDATLPVAGALTGGPLTGLAVLLAQQVMKDKVDKFNRIRYLISGSWDNPQVERTGGGGLSRILQPVTDLFDKPEESPSRPHGTPGK